MFLDDQPSARAETTDTAARPRSSVGVGCLWHHRPAGALYRATSWINGAATQAGRQGGATQRGLGEDTPTAGEKDPAYVARGNRAAAPITAKPSSCRVAEMRGCKLSICGVVRFGSSAPVYPGRSRDPRHRRVQMTRRQRGPGRRRPQRGLRRLNGATTARMACPRPRATSVPGRSQQRATSRKTRTISSLKP